MKIVTVVGARPQFIKAAMVSRSIAEFKDVSELIVHTGQHFDENMSAVFFEEMKIQKPAYNLGIGGGSHGKNTGRMLEAVETVLLTEKPHVLIVYGDTDSTLAGALAAVKLHIPVAHVEAGLRSFNREMPEEVNRVLTDHASTWLFAPTESAVQQLENEGVPPSAIFRTGDVMYDAARFYSRLRNGQRGFLAANGLEHKDFVLVTIHRPVNTDDRERLSSILDALSHAKKPVFWPVHPRTKKRMADFDLTVPKNVLVAEPVGFLDMVELESHARLIVTDSGGVQKEAFFHRTPCVTVREESEWTELIDLGVNKLVGSDWSALRRCLTDDMPEFPEHIETEPYGSGDAAREIAKILRSVVSS